MHIPQWLKIVVVLEMAGFANLAHAGSVVLNFAGMDSWTAVWTVPGVPLVQGPPTTLTLAFTNLNPISIVFTENGTAAASGFGFRLTAMSQNITNQTGVPWIGFSEVLQDTSSSPQGNAAHLGPAHFHMDTGFSGSQFTTVTGGSPSLSFVFGGGTVANGSAWTPLGIGIHDYQDQGAQRTFTLVLTPTAAVPEPGTFMLALGAALLAGARRMIRRPN